MGDWITLTAADYTPDMPPFENPGSGNISNCLPKTTNSYGPIAAFANYGGGTGLNLTCQGAYSVLDASDNVYIFAGDQKDLYKYTAASTSPVIASNGTHPYNAAAGTQWKFAYFGGRVIATDFESNIQSYVLGVSTNFADLAGGGITALTLVAGSGYTNGTYALTVSGPGSGTGFAATVTVSGGILISYTITNIGKNYPQTATISVPAGAGGGTGATITPAIATIAPQGRYIAVVKNFLCIANTNDAVNGLQPQAVWWSAINDPTYYPTPGTATAAAFQSSFNNLYGEGGFIQGIVGNLGTADGAVFMEHAVWRMVYNGPPNTFNFYPAEGVRGTPAPGSIVQLGAYVYYLGEDGFYVFDGTNSQPIGANRVDKTFFADANIADLGNMVGVADPINRMIYWGYTSNAGTLGVLDKILGYNWQLDKWTIITGSKAEYLFRGYTFGNNVLDVIGAVSLDSTTYNMFPMDSPVYSGGTILLSGFNSTGHILGYFNGPNISATIETTEKQLYQGRRAQIKNVRPLVDVNSNGISRTTIAVRDRLGTPPVYNAGNTINFLGTSPQIANGRYIRSSISLSSSDTWTEFQGIEIEATQSSVM